MTREQLGTIATLIIGWLLNEFTHWLRAYKEDRKPVAGVIADLLEMRHNIRGVTMYLSEMKKRFPITPDAELAIRRVIQALMPQTEIIHQRYDEGVTLVASLNPLLAFRLRSKDQVTPLMNKLRPLLEGNNLTKPQVLQIEDKLSHLLLRNFDELTLELAWAHSLRMWWRIRKHLAKPLDISKDIDEFLSIVQESGEDTKVTLASPS